MANTPVEVQANAPKPLETKTSPYKRVDDASIANLVSAERALKDSINSSALEAGVRDNLLKRIDDDIELAKNSGILRLNDAEKTVLLSDGDARSTGLADRQGKTKKIIEDAIAKLEEAIKDDVSKKLTAVHDTRRTLLDDSLNQEDQEVLDRAYQMFNSMLGLETNNITARPMGAPAESNLKTALSQMAHPNFEGNNNQKIHFTNGGNNANSNSPELLGVGMVAAGHKKITFSAKHPEIALRAAEAALDAGAEDFKFDEQTMQLLLRPDQPYYRNSTVEHKKYNDWYGRLRKRVDAIKYSKTVSKNRVFNEGLTKSEEHSYTFGQLSTPKDHREYLKSLTPEEQAQLAMKLYERNKESPTKSTYPLKGTNLDAPQYIARLVSDEQLEGEPPVEKTPPPFVKKEAKFLEHYEKLEKAKVATIPADINAVEQFNELKTSAARMEFYKKINALPPKAALANGEIDPSNPKVVRAAYLGALLDRSYKRLDAFPQYTQQQFKKETELLTTEIKNLMNGVPTEDQVATINLFTANYHRAEALVKNNNAIAGAGATQVTKVTDGTHLDPRTYNVANPEGDQYEGRRLIRNDKGLALYQHLVESSFHSFRHLAEPIAPVAAPQPNPAAPAQRPNPVPPQPRPVPAVLPAQPPALQTAKEYLGFLVNKMKNIRYAKEYLGLFVNKVRGLLPNVPAVAPQQEDDSNASLVPPPQQGADASFLAVEAGAPAKNAAADQHGAAQQLPELGADEGESQENAGGGLGLGRP